MDPSLDGGLKPKNTNNRGTKNIINPKSKDGLSEIDREVETYGNYGKI